MIISTKSKFNYTQPSGLKLIISVALGIAFAISLLAVILTLESSLSEFILNLWRTYPGLDKIVHGMAYFCIASGIYVFSLYILKIKTPALLFLTVTSISMLISFTDELVQLYTASRSFEIEDLIANAAGMTIAIAWFFRKKIKRTVAFTLIFSSIVTIFFFAFNTHQELKYFYAGMQHEKNKQYELAKQAYLKSILLPNKIPEAYNALAWVNIEFLFEDYQESIGYARKAVELRPDNADYLDTYGWSYYMNGDYENSLHYLLKSYNLDSNVYCIHYHLGMVYAKLNKPEKAIKHFRLQLVEHPDNSYSELSSKELIKISKK